MIHPGTFLENSWRVPGRSVHAVVLDTDLADRDTLAGLLSECLRVSRAGAHVLVRSEVLRTHLAAVALGDAGWEIEDRVTHFHGGAAEDWWLGTKPGGKKFLNVEACRAPRADLGMGDASGRWPTHVVFTHHGDCRPAGTRTFRSDVRWDKLKGEAGAGHALLGSLDASLNNASEAPPDWLNEDRTETVPVWECHADCAVRRLDDQAGIRVTAGRAAGDYLRGSRHGRLGDWSVGPGPALPPSSGPASRFFNTFTSDPEFRSWLVRLITPPGGTILFPSGPVAEAGFPTIGFKEIS